MQSNNSKNKLQNKQEIDFEDTNEYLNVIKENENRKEEYLDSNDKNKQLLSLRCISNVAKARIKLSNITPIDGFGVDQNITIIKIMEEDIEYVKRRFINSDEDKNLLQFISYLIPIYKELEKFLLDQGLNDLATRMYKKYMSLYIDRLPLLRDLKKIRKRRYKLKSWFEEIILRSFGFFFDYGLNLNKIISVTLILIILCGFIFWYYDCLIPIIEENKIVKLRHCVYYSIVTITSLGTEEFAPYGKIGKSLHFIEGIAGYIILGILVAHLSRRIK